MNTSGWGRFLSWHAGVYRGRMCRGGRTFTGWRSLFVLSISLTCCYFIYFMHLALVGGHKDRIIISVSEADVTLGSDGDPPPTPRVTLLSNHSLHDDYDVVVVGAGLSGAVMAHLFATYSHQRVLVVEKRNHIAGNCFDYVNEVGIRVSQYGAHLFHTKHPQVWRFVNQFSEWIPYEHRVVAELDGQYVPVPVNIDTVNLVLHQNISTPAQMRRWLDATQIKTSHLVNGEDAALSRVGRTLYEKIFKPYTYKQWSKYPHELNASVLLRIPVAGNYDDRYFPHDPYQALPRHGYTALVGNMLAHPNISVLLNTDYLRLPRVTNRARRVVYTGPIDQYFSSSGLPKLEYRSIHFHHETLYNTSFYQPNAVVNHPGGRDRFTRTVEYKHLNLLAQHSPHTTIVRELTTDTGEPYYSVPDANNQQLYAKYKRLAEKEEKTSGVHFVGRLANYKYFNMDEAILNAIRTYETIEKRTLSFPSVASSAEGDDRTTLTIIVNHCKENLIWLNELRHVYERYRTTVVLYEKCGGPAFSMAQVAPGSPILRRYTLPNAGREGHSWIDFILSKQSLFSDVNLFLQGKPHHTMAWTSTQIHTLTSNIKHLSARANFNQSIDAEQHFVAFNPQPSGTIPDSVGEKTYPHHIDADLACRWVRAFIPSDNCRIHVNYNGEMLVTEAALRRALNRHRAALTRLYRELGAGNDPVLGHILERLWQTIYTSQGC